MTNRIHVLILALRLLFAGIVACAFGTGLLYLVAGLLTPVPTSAVPTSIAASNSVGSSSLDRFNDDLEDRKRIRRVCLSMSCAFLGGSLCLVIMFVASKRWFPPYPEDPDYGILPRPTEEQT